MNSTALRAEVQSADNTHMVFADEEYEKPDTDDKEDKQVTVAARDMLKLRHVPYIFYQEAEEYVIL